MRDSIASAGAGLLSGGCTIVAAAVDGIGWLELKAAVATIVTAGLVFLAQEIRMASRDRGKRREEEEDARNLRARRRPRRRARRKAATVSITPKDHAQSSTPETK